ncbi:MAG: hypothetical protein FOGNACKC_03843 [Anaerolineae bacterium]|nr:hypothetical protein [Anaerolineae bacterium]
MAELLTTQQLIELLKVDRTTVYRMLKNGQLSGVKVGNQWRFPREQVDGLLSGNASNDPAAGQTSRAIPVIPLNCVQVIQNVFAEVAEVGAVTTAPDGEPLTEISNCCNFCQLILNSDSGRQACIGSWRRLADQSRRKPEFVPCHAGLQYARARIEVNDTLEGMLIAGQFYAAPPDPAEEQARITRLAQKHGIDETALARAATQLPVLDARKRERISSWLESVAQTFEQISCERADLMGRLQVIAQMSRFPAD